MESDFERMSPRQIVAELDKYIIGQEKAKKAVAVALRNRLRRNLLPEDIKDEVAPKNIIMIGPTGVGKTEIARRLTKLSGAPFIKVEATKFTEVGYVGRDVESMVRDLMAASLAIVKNELAQSVAHAAEKRAEERLLDILLPASAADNKENSAIADATDAAAREKFRVLLRKGELDERKVEISTSAASMPAGLLGGIEIFPGSGAPDESDIQSLGSQLSAMFSGKKKRRTSVKQAKEIFLAEERDKLIDNESAIEIARERAEKQGIVFIDEIDKIAGRESKAGGGPDISREGVQRDILPIIEGSSVSTKYGVIDTSHILFIAAGAFNISKPSDLIPELQGRFPIRVELEEMSADFFEQILTKPQNALIRQYTELLKTENVEIHFSLEAIKRIASVAAEQNISLENIGARRLHAVMEAVLEDLSFNAPEMAGQKVKIDEAYVDEKLRTADGKQDLHKYIL